MYKTFLKPILFRLSPEKAHHLVFRLTKFGLNFPILSSFIKASYQTKNTPVEILGLKFPNRVGLAAGLDKNAVLYKELGALGFGFVEIGTITPLPQPGNPQPRLFRLPNDEALINRMGFNNDGIEGAITRLKHRDKNLIIGGNIGKNKVTPNEEAVNDYIKCFEGLHDYVDYFVVNVSSPNTPNLRALQDKGPLLHILSTLVKKRAARNSNIPILLKIAPDLTNEQLDDIVDIVAESKIEGVIATNTTIERNLPNTDKSVVENIGAGGLSGKPVKNKSTEVIRYLSEKSNGSFPIIGVGGIHNADDALEKIKAGAALVQIYTGFIYEGPDLIKSINKKFEAEL